MRCLWQDTSTGYTGKQVNAWRNDLQAWQTSCQSVYDELGFYEGTASPVFTVYYFLKLVFINISTVRMSDLIRRRRY